MMIRWTTALPVAVILLYATTTFAAVTNERNYTLGDDSLENATVGTTLGTGSGANGATFDSGDPGDPSGSFIDLTVNGDPQYVDVTSRPGAAASSLGASFDGVDDSLSSNFYVNRPSDFWDDINLFVNQDYVFNYEGILSHGIQLWAKPNAAGIGNRQQLILDTSDGGGVYISAGGNWGLSYDDDTNDQFVSSVAADTSGGWTHLMQLGGVADPIGGTSAAVGVLLVDGVAVAATNDIYDGQTGEPLVVGSNLAGDAEFYNGELDDIRIFLWGDNSSTPAGPNGQLGMNYGALDLSTDNDWIAQELASLGVTDPADVNLSGGSANLDDVTAFVNNWMSVRTVDGVQVGDWVSRQNGDLNYDGIVDLRDWGIVNASNPSAGAAILAALGGSNAIPEPSTLLLAGIACLAVGAVARRR